MTNEVLQISSPVGLIAAGGVMPFAVADSLAARGIRPILFALAKRRMEAGLTQAWADFRAELETCEALDDERVLVLTENSGRGRTSGVDVGQIRTRGANVFHIRNGKVTRLVAYWSRERALADLGLAAEPSRVG